jgi:hypothetical protein
LAITGHDTETAVPALSLVASLGQKPLGQDVSQVEKARIILKCNL